MNRFWLISMIVLVLGIGAYMGYRQLPADREEAALVEQPPVGIVQRAVTVLAAAEDKVAAVAEVVAAGSRQGKSAARGMHGGQAQVAPVGPAVTLPGRIESHCA